MQTVSEAVVSFNENINQTVIVFRMRLNPVNLSLIPDTTL